MELTEKDFKSALEKLLPPGEYWKADESQDLDRLLDGIAAEMMATHLDISNQLIEQNEAATLGWKIADFQQIFDNALADATVTDSPLEPNVIRVFINKLQNLLDPLIRAESHRLAHTALNWTFPQSVGITANFKTLNFRRAQADQPTWKTGIGFANAYKKMTFNRMTLTEA